MTASDSVQRNLIDIAKLNRNAAYRLKNGSPKFREVLRKRCGERIKGSRARLLDKLRNLSCTSDVEVVLQVLNSEEDSCEKLYEAPITEEEENIIAEYEAFLMYEESMLADMVKKSMGNEVICPFCQKCALEKQTAPVSSIICSGCFARVPTPHSLSYIGQLLQKSVDTHSLECYTNPQFHILHEDSNAQICMMCQTCSYMDIIL